MTTTEPTKCDCRTGWHTALYVTLFILALAVVGLIVSVNR